MFTTALFTIARTWKQLRCPFVDEGIKKMHYIFTIDYYSVIKWNELESLLVRWMNLEPVIHSAVSHKEQNKYHILIYAYIWNLEKWQ